MNNETVIKRDKAYVANTYNRFNVVIKEGKGAWAIDEEGKHYLDFSAGIGVNSLGYCYPAWVEATTKQLQTLNHCSNLFYNPQSGAAAEKLCQRTHFKKVLYVNSGAEANEIAIKIARKYGHDHYDANHHDIITLDNSFHGRTITTLSATGQDHFHENFAPFDEGFSHVTVNDISALEAAISENTCAIMIELVQGEGGVIPLDKAYVQAIAALCAQKELLLMVDEVQTGVGRTGKLFSYEHFDIQPDIITCAKGLGAGLPIGAVLVNEKTEHVMGLGDHGSTFGANPVVCAGVNVVLDTIDEAFLLDVQAKGEYLKAKLSALPHVKAVTGLGLMIGVQFDDCDARAIVNACIDRGVLFLTAKDRLRLLPPLIINLEEIDQGMDCLKQVLETVDTHD